MSTQCQKGIYAKMQVKHKLGGTLDKILNWFIYKLSESKDLSEPVKDDILTISDAVNIDEIKAWLNRLMFFTAMKKEMNIHLLQTLIP